MGGTGPFSPSPVRPLDGRVGLDPKGLGKHVCWKKKVQHRSHGLSGKRERDASPTRSPGGSHAGARLQKEPGWKPGLGSNANVAAAETAAAPSGRARNRSRVGRGQGKAGRTPGRPSPDAAPTARYCACASGWSLRVGRDPPRQQRLGSFPFHQR